MELNNTKRKDRIIHLMKGQGMIPNYLLNSGISFGVLYHPVVVDRELLIDENVLTTHVYVEGITGSGKTSLVYVVQDGIFIKKLDNPNATGSMYIDPLTNGANGLITRVLHAAKAKGLKATDLDYFHYMKFADDVPLGYKADHIPGLNLLYYEPGDDLQELIDSTMSIIDTAIPTSPGGAVRMEKFLKNTFGLLLLDNRLRSEEGDLQHTILDAAKAIKSKAFRRGILERIEPLGLDAKPFIDFWAEYEGTDIKPETLDAIETRLNIFAVSPVLRRVFGQASMIPLTKWLDEGHIVYVDLGRLSETAKKLISCSLTERCYRAGKNKRKNKNLYILMIDEVAQAQVPCIPDITMDGRQFGLGLFPLNQYHTQLNDKIRVALLNNTGTQCFGKLSGSVAKEASNASGNRFSAAQLEAMPTSVFGLVTQVKMNGEMVKMNTMLKSPPPYIYTKQGKIADYKNELEMRQARIDAFIAIKPLIERDFQSVAEIDAQIKASFGMVDESKLDGDGIAMMQQEARIEAHNQVMNFDMIEAAKSAGLAVVPDFN
ncbi:hypothetical protein [Culicoidibacter larvae]|uniref:TraD/TraG TraM recognition site domain-containing protein n=1 Tax=Culicoidibacter larvae TaxID=2579976 RepID=A0A5R8Q904_9FIRM|nr:hypothetical protein [Culicoidibacter larvae]TLG71284.1 hypothetical protein FEZ08_11075 [Culicoidibacter larvae]